MTSPLAFSDLKKLPDVPAAKVLTEGNAVLQTTIDAPASASIAAVLAELEAKGALLDMLQLLAHALPAREAVWWSCLSARETVAEGAALPPSLKAAEAWVYQPGQDTRAKAREALDTASNEDETVLCAMAAAFAAGTLGPGELDDFAAPAGAVGAAAFGMALTSLFHDEDKVEERGKLLLARALDIARGGNGNVLRPRTANETPRSSSQTFEGEARS
ncbi:DUF6931 family protein [Roseibium sp.]|uniref:DUF6931 family protein n=1 Tax=Roseibium sp. TaxID=1936156 RepID=UPI003A987B40